MAVAAGSGGGTMAAAAAAAWLRRSDGGSLVAAMAAARWQWRLHAVMVEAAVAAVAEVLRRRLSTVMVVAAWRPRRSNRWGRWSSCPTLSATDSSSSSSSSLCFVLGQGWREDGADRSSSLTAEPVATSTVAAAAQTTPKASLTISFVKLNSL